MLNRRKAHLDALEERLTGPKRVALFGHRAVGKTTLLAMFYREASNGRVPGVRLAAGDAVTAEYLADKIAQIEAGEPPAGTLAETPLRLRLYHGLSRLDLIVKDYQGEHVTLGVEAPIREFFADCEAVLLCLDPQAADDAVSRRRRQQEVEDLLERYIERSTDGTAGRPVALLVTKYDRVIERGGPHPGDVSRLVESKYGMTRHALAQHAPRSAMFAVSSFGPEAGPDGRPPAELSPMGLEGPLSWLAEQLEEIDREQLEWLWDLAPDDLPRLARCVKVFERRYPRSDSTQVFRRRLGDLRRRRNLKRGARVVVGLALVAASVFGYDAWGYRDALAFERAGHPATAVETRWDRLLTRHPTLAWTFPQDASRARRKLAEWQVKAAGLRVKVGTAGPEVAVRMNDLKEQAPDLLLQINQVERAEAQAQGERAWRELRVGDLIAVEDPEAHLAAVRRFLREHPDTPHKEEAVALARGLEARVAERRATEDRQAIDALARAAGLPDVPLSDLVEQAEQFLAERPESRYKGEVEEMLDRFVRRMDEADIEKARQFSRSNPTNFAVRREKYLDYLKAHAEGGRFVAEANAALEQVERERDVYLYRQAYDHALAHPDDVPAVAGRLRSYLEANPQGRFAEAAKGYIRWWEQISAPGEYRVVLRRGRVDSDVGKAFSGAGPDLNVKVWVAGVEYGPSPVVKDTRTPIWDWAFPVPIRWKYGDPISIRILDNDWSATSVFTLTTRQGDKLAMRMLSGTVRPSKGGRTELVFASDFREPKLPKPE
jgi:GTPase SAR1 family protein